MFAYIKGSIEQKAENYVIIETGGIGYKIFMSAKSIKKLGDIKELTKIYTYYYVREDNISLYGFTSSEELKAFELLLSVSGIGAKSAITMLSEITPSSFAIAVITNDIVKLTKVPGIGKKTAQRIILELKDKLKNDEISSDNIEESYDKQNINEEAISALQVLGYTKREIENVLVKFDYKNMEIEETIKTALKYLSK